MAIKKKIKKAAVEEDLDLDLLGEDGEVEDGEVEDVEDEDGEDEDEDFEEVTETKKVVKKTTPSVKKTAPPTKKTVPSVKKTATPPTTKKVVKSKLFQGKTAKKEVNLDEVDILTATDFSNLLKQKLSDVYPSMSLADAEKIRRAFIEVGETLINKKVSFTMFFGKRINIRLTSERVYAPIKGKTDTHTLVPEHYEAKFRYHIDSVKIPGKVKKDGTFIPAK